MEETMAKPLKQRGRPPKVRIEAMEKRKRGKPPIPTPSPKVRVEAIERRKRGSPPKVEQKGGRALKYDPLLPGFFKIYLPEHNSKQLVVPVNFIKKFNGEVSKEIILKNSQGKVWDVELEKAGSKLLIKKGWERFVIDNALERGEFLTFTYRKKDVFIVEIFGINGCEKAKTMATDQSCVKLKQEPNLVSPEVVTTTIRFTKVMEEKTYDMNIPARLFSEHNIQMPKVKTSDVILVRNKQGFSQEMKLWHRIDRVVISQGLKKFQQKCNIRKGNECEFEIVLGKDRKIKEVILLQIRPTKKGCSKSCCRNLLGQKTGQRI